MTERVIRIIAYLGLFWALNRVGNDWDVWVLWAWQIRWWIYKMSTPVEKREDLKVEYEAEFDKDSVAIVPAEQLAREITGLLGPSTRQQVLRISAEFRKKINEADAEVMEMMEREVALKNNNQALLAHNIQLAQERDEWRAQSDPAGEISRLTEEVSQLQAKLAGEAKMTGEWKKRVDDLADKSRKDDESRKELMTEIHDLRARLAAK